MWDHTENCFQKFSRYQKLITNIEVFWYNWGDIYSTHSSKIQKPIINIETAQIFVYCDIFGTNSFNIVVEKRFYSFSCPFSWLKNIFVSIYQHFFLRYQWEPVPKVLWKLWSWESWFNFPITSGQLYSKFNTRFFNKHSCLN